MKRWIVGITVASVLLVVGAIVYVASLDVNRYKPGIVAVVEDVTGRSFAIQGDIGLKLSLIPTLVVEGVTFGNAKWAAHETMITVARFEAHAALLPFLRGNTDIKRLVIDGAEIKLERDRKGRGNWLVNTRGDDDEIEGKSLPTFYLDELIVRDSTIVYRDFEAEPVTVSIVELSLSSDGFGRPIDVILEATVDEAPVTLSGEISRLRHFFANEPYSLALAGRAAGVDFGVDGEIEAPLDGTGIALEARLNVSSFIEIGALTGTEMSDFPEVTVTGKLSDSKNGYALDDLRIVAGLSDLSGRVTLDLDDDVPFIGAELQSTMIDTGAFGKDDESTAKSARLFSKTPIPFAALRAFDADIHLTVQTFVSSGMQLDGLNTRMRLKDGRLTVDPFRANVGGGTLDGIVTIDAAGVIPSIRKQVTIKGLSIGKMPAFREKGALVGDKTDITVTLEGRGQSAAAIMAGANGRILIDTRGGKINNALADAVTGDVLVNAFQYLNPLSKKDVVTVIDCAVINLPIKDGIATNDTAFGITTDKLNILGGGTINFKTEAIDIGVKPKPREGVGLNVASLVDFVRIGGTLTHPRPTTDALGVATAGVKVGAALMTMGLSVLAEGIFDRATAGADVCAVARGNAPISADSGTRATEKREEPSAMERTKEVARSAGAKVKGALNKLFNN